MTLHVSLLASYFHQVELLTLGDELCLLYHGLLLDELPLFGQDLELVAVVFFLTLENTLDKAIQDFAVGFIKLLNQVNGPTLIHF